MTNIVQRKIDDVKTLKIQHLFDCCMFVYSTFEQARIDEMNRSIFNFIMVFIVLLILLIILVSILCINKTKIFIQVFTWGMTGKTA